MAKVKNIAKNIASLNIKVLFNKIAGWDAF